MEEAADLLNRYESADGGWGYYDDYGTKVPGHWTTSFTTASGLIALKMAKDRGAKIPERLVARGVRVVEMCRFPNDAFAYAIDHYRHPTGPINHIKGSLARTPVTQDIPSLAEATGVKSIDVDIWYAAYVPAGTHADIVGRLNAEMNALLRQADVRETLGKQGLAATGGTQEQLAQMTRRDMDRWAKVVQAAKIEAD